MKAGGDLDGDVLELPERSHELVPARGIDGDAEDSGEGPGELGHTALEPVPPVVGDEVGEGADKTGAVGGDDGEDEFLGHGSGRSVPTPIGSFAEGLAEFEAPHIRSSIHSRIWASSRGTMVWSLGYSLHSKGMPSLLHGLGLVPRGGEGKDGIEEPVGHEPRRVPGLVGEVCDKLLRVVEVPRDSDHPGEPPSKPTAPLPGEEAALGEPEHEQLFRRNISLHHLAKKPVEDLSAAQDAGELVGGKVVPAEPAEGCIGRIDGEEGKPLDPEGVGQPVEPAMGVAPTMEQEHHVGVWLPVGWRHEYMVECGDAGKRLGHH